MTAAALDWRHVLALVASLTLAPLASHAASYKAGTLVIEGPYALPTPKTATSAMVFVHLDNQGDQTVHLTGAKTPLAGIVEIQQLVRAGKSVKARKMLVLNVEARDRLDFTPDGDFRILLIGLQKRLEDGDRFPLTLEFDALGKVDVMVEVQSNDRVDTGARVGKRTNSY